jgi:hypothetical protein
LIEKRASLKFQGETELDRFGLVRKVTEDRDKHEIIIQMNADML